MNYVYLDRLNANLVQSRCVEINKYTQLAILEKAGHRELFHELKTYVHFAGKNEYFCF